MLNTFSYKQITKIMSNCINIYIFKVKGSALDRRYELKQQNIIEKVSILFKVQNKNYQLELKKKKNKLKKNVKMYSKTFEIKFK